MLTSDNNRPGTPTSFGDIDRVHKKGSAGLLIIYREKDVQTLNSGKISLTKVRIYVIVVFVASTLVFRGWTIWQTRDQSW